MLDTVAVNGSETLSLVPCRIGSFPNVAMCIIAVNLYMGIENIAAEAAETRRGKSPCLKPYSDGISFTGTRHHNCNFCPVRICHVNHMYFAEELQIQAE